MMLPDPKPEEIQYVCDNLRSRSAEDIFGVTDQSTNQFAQGLIYSSGFKWVGYANGLPAALIGAYPIHPGVWGLFGFGTDDWRLIWRDVTRVARRDMMTAVSDAGAHRAHCVSPSDHKETHAWLRMLGATVETPMPKYGIDGQDYLMFAWVKET